jgi:hypothetical protein
MVPSSARNWIAVKFKNPTSVKYESLGSGTPFTFLKIFENFDLQITGEG